jgi:RimJ/RimL family protein N-acetyltransferase
MPALTIAVLKANVPAQRFYEAIGGQFVRVGEIEDSGYMLPEIVYGWADTDPKNMSGTACFSTRRSVSGAGLG